MLIFASLVSRPIRKRTESGPRGTLFKLLAERARPTQQPQGLAFRLITRIDAVRVDKNTARHDR